MKEVPAGYRDSYIDFVKNGARVLALSYRDLKMQKNQAEQLTREEAESELVFCGFLVSECPLKEDSKAVIEELYQSAHEVKMITVKKNTMLWKGIRDEVKKWVIENWWKWKEEQPTWFTDNWIAKVPDDMIPTEKMWEI